MNERSMRVVVVNELRAVTGRDELELTDLIGWSPSEKTARAHAGPEREAVYLPKTRLWAVIPSAASRVAEGRA